MDSIPLSGFYDLQIRDRFGEVIEKKSGENLVVESGFFLYAKLAAGEAVSAVSHMAVGDNNQQPQLDQTALLGTELARVTTTTSRSESLITYTADFSSITSTISVSEFGIFNDATAGDMLARFVVDTFDLFSGQSMDIEWTIRMGQ